MGQVTYDAGKIEAVGREVRLSILAFAREAAQRMAGALVSAYPSVTGALRRGVTARNKRQADTGSLVQTRAAHAHLYELGTRQRFDATHANRRTGAMPNANVFVPLAIRTRDGFARDAQTMLNRDREIV